MQSFKNYCEFDECWTGYVQRGMKKKGDKMVPNCVPAGSTSEEVETADEAMLDPSKSKAARLFRQGQKQHDPERQDKAYELRKQANRARAKRKYDKMSPEQKSAKDKADYDWRRGREDQAKKSMAPDVRKSMAHSKGPHQEK